MRELPDDLVARPFRTGAPAVPSRHELAGPLWRAPHHGVRAWALSDGADPRVRAREAWLLVPDGGAVGGWAAAHLLGVADFDGRGPGGTTPEDVLLCLPRRARVDRPGVRTLRSPLAADDIVEIDGVPVTSPVRTAYDLARTLPRAEGVVALDAMARAGVLCLADFGRYVARRVRWRGAPAARAALALADARSRSAGESRLRVLWVVDAGLPVPEVNADVVDPDGALLGVVDLLDPSAGLGGEYDGAGHQRLAQLAADHAREEWLERAGLIIVRVTAIDLTRYGCGPWSGSERRARRVSAGTGAGTAGRGGSDRCRRDRWT